MTSKNDLNLLSNEAYIKDAVRNIIEKDHGHMRDMRQRFTSLLLAGSCIVGLHVSPASHETAVCDLDEKSVPPVTLVH